MKKELVKNIVVLPLLFLIVCIGDIQTGHAQDRVPDTLKQLLRRITAGSTDESLKLAVAAAQASGSNQSINDSLLQKLLLVDSLLVNTTSAERSLAFSYAGLMVEIFKGLPPAQEHPAYVTSLNNLGLLNFRAGKYDSALALFQQVLSIRKKTTGEGDLRYAASLNSLAVVYNQMGQYDKALPLSLESLETIRKIAGEDNPRFASGLNNLAALYRRMGQYDKALPQYQQALNIKRKLLGEQHPDYAGSLNNLAYLYNLMGQFNKALPLYERALDIQKDVLGKENSSYSATLNNLAYLYSNMGQYEKALPLYEQALAIDKKVLGEDHPDYAASLNNLANLYSSMGQYTKALPLQEKSILIHKKSLGEAHPAYAAGLNNLADLLKSMQEYNKALPVYEQALAIKKKTLGENHPDYALSLNNLGLLYQKTGKHEKAVTLLQHAIEVYKRVVGEEHPDYASTLNNLAISYAALGDTASATALFLAATNRTLKNLVQTYPALSEGEKLTFLENESYQFNYLPSLLLTQGKSTYPLANQVYNTQLDLKGMVLEDQQNVLRSIRKSGDSTALRLYEKWRINKSFVARQLLLPVSRRLPYLDSLEETTNQLEQQLSVHTVAFRNLRQNRMVTANDVARHLQKGEAAVEFVSFKVYRNGWTDSIQYAALVMLPGDTNAVFVPLFEERVLQRMLTGPSGNNPVNRQPLYAGLTKGNTGTLPVMQDSLYDLIWRPIEHYLEGTGTIYFSPAGLLHRVAFQVLKADDGRFLIEKYQLNQVLSTRCLALPRDTTPKPLTASLWGNVSYNITESLASHQTRGLTSADTTASSFNFYTADTRNSRGPGWDALPFSKQEIDSVKKVLVNAGIPAATSSGTMATEESFKALDGVSPQVLHLATHGFFLPPAQSRQSEFESGGGAFMKQQNPMFRSGLVLAGGNQAWGGARAVAGKEDGILTAYEIAQMDLSNTRLVILSACGTALGDIQKNEGVIGLQRAIKMAGVKQMIISLWDVPDKTTCELMVLFYRFWLGGETPRKALRLAQLKLKEKYPPYFWAAFVLVE